MTTIQTNLQAVHARIAAACVRAGRPENSVTLLAVSKTCPATKVIDAISCGQNAFGENYVQEGVDKIIALANEHTRLNTTENQALNPVLNLTWHFIGPLQSNKTRLVAEYFDWVQSIDRLKIAERLAMQRPGYLPPLQVCIQVNISGEATKSGCSPTDLPVLAQAIRALPGLCLRGLMAIPEPSDDEALQYRQFRQLSGLLAQLNAEGFALDTLSMGMSHDLEMAILAGATMVRVGTAIFGERVIA